MTREELKQAAIDYLVDAFETKDTDAPPHLVTAATAIVLEPPPYTPATMVPATFKEIE